MNFQSFSQVGQDCFAWGMNGGKPGTFLDIGCGHPTAYSNTYGLELVGWEGVCVDIHREPAWDSPVNPRKPTLIIGDATKWETLKPLQRRSFDYISIDCDEKSLAALETIFELEISAQCITIEHDRYRLGDAQREGQRKLLRYYLYGLARGDVLWEGKPFEDWWVHSL
jgi:hypothetical protein